MVVKYSPSISQNVLQPWFRQLFNPSFSDPLPSAPFVVHTRALRAKQHAPGPRPGHMLSCTERPAQERRPKSQGLFLLRRSRARALQKINLCFALFLCRSRPRAPRQSSSLLFGSVSLKKSLRKGPFFGGALGRERNKKKARRFSGAFLWKQKIPGKQRVNFFGGFVRKRDKK